MTRFLKALLSVLLLTFTFQASLGAQGQIQTKKYRLSDFTSRTIKVVTGSSPMLDGVLMDEVTSHWRISPYEFCTMEEYEKLRKDPSYYFLMPAKGQGLTALTVARGGVTEGLDPAKEAFDVIWVPIASADDPSGRETTFLPAVLAIIQDYIELAMTSEAAGISGLAAVTRGSARLSGKRICICEDDLAPLVTEEMKEDLAARGVLIFDIESADGVFASGQANTLVSWTVAPSTPGKGAFCYKVLIDSGTYELFYFQRHPLKDADSKGFLPADIKKITSGLKRRK